MYVYGGELLIMNCKVLWVLVNEGYLVGYSEVLGNLLWVVYCVCDVEVLEVLK